MVDHNGRGLRLRLHDLRPVARGRHARRGTLIFEFRIIFPVCKRILNGVLHLGVHRKVDAVSAALQLAFDRGAVGLGVQQVARCEQVRHHILHCVFHEIKHVIHAGTLGFLLNVNRVRKCGIPLLFRDKSRFVHLIDDHIRARIGDVHLVLTVFIEALIHVFSRVGPVRRLDHAGDHRAFADAQLGKILAEVILCGGLYAIVGTAEINIVQVSFQHIAF